MKELLFVLASVLLAIISAIAHEQDIYQSCITKGYSGAAMWTASIICGENNLKEITK